MTLQRRCLRRTVPHRINAMQSNPFRSDSIQFDSIQSTPIRLLFSTQYDMPRPVPSRPVPSRPVLSSSPPLLQSETASYLSSQTVFGVSTLTLLLLACSTAHRSRQAVILVKKTPPYSTFNGSDTPWVLKGSEEYATKLSPVWRVVPIHHWCLLPPLSSHALGHFSLTDCCRLQIASQLHSSFTAR